jgi:hypothetical protein
MTKKDGAISGLRYAGDGSGFPHIPARNLSSDDLARIGALLDMSTAELAQWLIGSGLYTAIRTQPSAEKPEET